MSYSNMNNVKMVDKSLVDKILEQGQKLRNAMVGSILKNDPFNTEIIYNKQFTTPQTSKTDLDDFKRVDNLTSIDEKRVEAFIRGEYMTKSEEKLALDTLKLLSAPALYKTTEKSLSSRLSSCRCYTCEMYNSNNLYCDLRRKNVAHSVPNISETTKDIRDKYGTENYNILKHVDSLKVSISSLILNERGSQKVSLYEDKKVPYSLSQTYFLEYNVPDSLVGKNTVSKSKVNSGLETNQVRLCSRRNDDTVNFKQVTVHDIKGLDRVNLDECELTFKISYRTTKQKTASLLGFARFNFGSFTHSKNLTCHRGLSVFLNETSPIVVGVLKVSLQLGCGRLYFGQEFVDAINSTRRNSVVLDSDDSASQLNDLTPVQDKVSEEHVKGESSRKLDLPKSNVKPTTEVKRTVIDKQVDTSSLRPPRNNLQTVNKQSSYFKQSSAQSLHENTDFRHIVDSVHKYPKEFFQSKVVTQQISENEKQILFGFLYISEAQYLSDPITTYITCRPFCQNETSRSQLVTNSSHPIFNFCQLVPLIFEDELLHLLRENYMVIEFWKKTDTTDVVFGLTKIFLHQFYLAYRNSVILKYIVKNQLPVIGTDWWEPIYAINTEEILGQVQILIALGTERQITNLKNERGFANNIVRSKFSDLKLAATEKGEKKETQNCNKKVSIEEPDGTNGIIVSNRVRNGGVKQVNGVIALPKTSLKKDLVVGEKKLKDQAVNTSILPKPAAVEKSDVGIQLDIQMEKKTEAQEAEKGSSTQEMLGSFLNQLLTQRQRNVFVENGTNTENPEPPAMVRDETLHQAQVNTNVELRKTTDLLDSLQRALSLDGINESANAKKQSNCFKASVMVNSANHLPSRKKCKSKKSRNRSMKNEENVLPSCYVTFETIPGNNMRITQVVSKSTAPVWSYRCEVDLPADLLTNNQKRLIFKVWRKSTNAVLQPNLQTDTVLGFAAVDLTVLLMGFPNVQGWFNIVDFSGKNNGQINIHITPLEDLSRFTSQKECNCTAEDVEKEPTNADPEAEPPDTLSRALKRKFTELDEITQRLRLRLSKVTSEESEGSSDGMADEFENDINTLCIEEDFNLINFEEEARIFNTNHSKDNVDGEGSSEEALQGGLVKVDESDGSASSGNLTQVGVKKSVEKNAEALTVDVDMGTEKELATLDKQLMQGKQRIDTLLEKLSLLSADTNNPFGSRYVSGCSINSDNALAIDTEAILKELDHGSRPNIQSVSGFDPLVFQQLYGGSVYSNSLKTSTVTTSGSCSNSDTSLVTDFSDCRPAPDGQGNASDEKAGKKS